MVLQLSLSGRTREIGRKITQVGFGIAVITAVLFWNPQYALWVIAGLAVAFVLADMLIIDLGIRLPIWAQLERRHEQATLHAATYMLLGAAFALAFYEQSIALAAIAAQSFGDSAASIARGFRPFRGKRLSIWMALVSLAGAYLFTKNFPISLVIALVAWLVEGASRLVDDNLTVPVLGGAAGQLVLLALRALGFAS